MEKRFPPLVSLLAIVAIASGLTTAVRAMEPGVADALAAGFENPPAAAKPRVWWHWMNGNITQEGIRLDMEWMSRVGIGGLQNFDAAFLTPELVQPRLVYMTPEWQQAFLFAASTASKLGLELSVAGSPGWSESGGPWVRPEDAMKKLVWSETRFPGGIAFTGKLPQPPATIGPFQNVPIDRNSLTAAGEPITPIKPFYADIAVIAYRLPDTERSMADLKPTVTSSAGPIDGSLLWDGDLAHSISVPFGSDGQAAWIQLAFDRPQTIRALTLALLSGRGTPFMVDPTITVAELQSSSDARQFTTVIDIKASTDVQQTLAFAPTRARYFRLMLPTPAPARSPIEGLNFGANNPTEHRIAELVLHTSSRVNRAEDKAAYFVAPSLDGTATPDASPMSVIRKEQIIDLTSHMRPDGSLEWTPPSGRWAVLRLGCSLLGITNHPASPEGTGLEVDKLNRAHVLDSYTQYLDRFAAFLGPDLMGHSGLHGMVNDSWEAGAQNWTENLPEEFARRRGYDLRPWLPALTGRVIESAEATDGFLWDFRQTLGDMVAEYHYETIAAELHKRGMIHYAESHEQGRAFIGDGMAVKRFADVPMSAMWAGGVGPQDRFDTDIRESASVAHQYGRPIVAAESFTAAGNTFAYTPEMLKPTADRELADGLNRFVIHTSVHQPLNDPGPGFTLGPFGQWFTRHETWAEQAGPWISYLTRSAYLMQQGQIVADVLYFYGEDSNLTALYAQSLPPIPEGYNFDFANLQTLSLLSVRDDELVTQSGMRYRVLALDPRARIMSLPVLIRLRDLVDAGAILVAAKPLASPSLADDSVTFRSIADTLWGAGVNGSGGAHSIGKGRIISDSSLADALNSSGVQPDFSYTKPAADSKLWFVHRHLSDGDLYFVNNRQPRAETIDASFRITGKAPELWRADTGRREPISYRSANGRTTVQLALEPADAVFVVFRKDATEPTRTIAQPVREPLRTLDGPWELRFPTGQAAPTSIEVAKLESWTDNTDPGVKYFSGTADYSLGLNIPSSWLQPPLRIEIDLGSVKNLAEVCINGKSLGVLWKYPFRLDITDALRVGANRLEVKVTNAWVNRLIGDQQPGSKQYAYASFDPYKADSPLLESGLLGPVRLIRKTNQ
jgi:hypothetical protein